EITVLPSSRLVVGDGERHALELARRLRFVPERREPLDDAFQDHPRTDRQRLAVDADVIDEAERFARTSGDELERFEVRTLVHVAETFTPPVVPPADVR